MGRKTDGSDGRTWRRLRGPGILATVALAVGLSACGADSSSETTSTSVPTTVGAPGQATATTIVAARSGGSAPEATRALCGEIESAGRTVAEGRYVAGGLALSRAVNTYGEKADPTVVDPARRMLAAGLDGDLDAGAVAVGDAATACGRLGYPLDLPVETGGGDGGGGGKWCVTTPCN